MTDEDGPSEIQRVLRDAREAVSEWLLARQLAADGSEKPNVRTHRIRAQHAVLHVVETLRPYLIGDLPAKYWRSSRSDIPSDVGTWLYYDPESDEGLPGLAHTMQYRGKVRKRTQVSADLNGREVQHVEEPALLPPKAIQTALSWVEQASYELGFLNEPNKRRRAYNASTMSEEEAGRIFETEEDDSIADMDEDAVPELPGESTDEGVSAGD